MYFPLSPLVKGLSSHLLYSLNAGETLRSPCPPIIRHCEHLSLLKQSGIAIFRTTLKAKGGILIKPASRRWQALGLTLERITV
jgi:hypothetical protein